MKNKMLVLLLSSAMIIPMTGCNTNIRLFGKEIFSAQEYKQEYKDVEQKQQEEYKPIQEEQTEYSEKEILSLLLTGDYTLTINGVNYVYNTEEMLKVIFDNNPQYKIEHYSGNQYLVQVSNMDVSNFITFLIDTNSTNIETIEFCYNGELVEGDDASTVMAQTLYQYYFNEEDGTLAKKQQETKEEKSPTKENTSKKEEKKEEKKQETPKTCKWCYTNQLPSGSGENDKCTECQAENWNFICSYCNKNMSLEEYHSYGEDTGMCPSCYDEYIQSQYQSENTDTEHKTYYCDRCGKDTTFKNFLQHFEGWDIICEACLMELGY